MKPVKIKIKPIGFVKTDASEEQVKSRKTISEIILNKKLSKALDGIEDFSHLFVIFSLHKISEDEKRTLKVHPRGRLDMPLLGIFATRTPFRPNPIGLTLVKLLKRKGNVLKVKGLDAINGTPVLDIKPFDYWDTVKKIRVPEWRKKLEEERKRENRKLS
ncbi:MAG: tRNA (N6-threonylcarbamoyladenosine(37)-N6)-methyltransferase TrmO [Euryarchaeota archaeon]|nr:tRNA (N6-threonylcarbamoyladenosine(37)-N6)-methyltransferase TrmO [Euryarchaeota archaeon]